MQRRELSVAAHGFSAQVGHKGADRLVIDPVAIKGPSSILFRRFDRGLRHLNDDSLKKKTVSKPGDDLRSEYDLSQLPGGIRGKNYKRAAAGTNLVLIEPDLAPVFPDTAAGNRALRVVVERQVGSTTHPAPLGTAREESYLSQASRMRSVNVGGAPTSTL